jgi:hypothetical protein
MQPISAIDLIEEILPMVHFDPRADGAARFFLGVSS